MKMKQLINCMFLIVNVWTLLHFSAADQYDYLNDIWNLCGNSGKNEFFGEERFFDRIQYGQNSNGTVYGLLQCRGDLNSSECNLCAKTAKAKLQCDNTSAIIQLNGCFLRYDNSNFYNVSSYGTLNNYICSKGVAPIADQSIVDAKSRLANISKQVLQTPKLFVADSLKDASSPSYYIYSIAECDRDMSLNSCNACLALGLSGIFDTWCTDPGVIGAQFYSSNCRLRFETYEFFDVSAPAPPSSAPAQTRGESVPPSSAKSKVDLAPCPSDGGISVYDWHFTVKIPSLLHSTNSRIPDEGSAAAEWILEEAKKSNVLRIPLGVAAVVVGTIAVIGLCKWIFFSTRKRWEHISGKIGEINRRLVIVFTGEEGSEIGLYPTISNLELIFKYDILREATSNFKDENKLGQGGFGSVFKGNLPDGRVVAVKRLNLGSSQGDAEFLNEANLISCIQHRNLVKLLGCSFQNSERLLVYEYLPNSSLDKILFDPTKRHLLNWNERYEIIVGTARGLAYLHEESDIRIIHRDIKASNILLDNKLRPKIADFGLARLFGEDQTHVTTGIAGTIGYMAPEYALRGQLTEKADVFSFGVLVLEIISGRKNNSLATDMEFLIEKTWRLYKTGKASEIMDPTLQDSYSWEKWIRLIKIGLLCTQAAASLRPSMSRVVSMLTGEREHLPSPTRPTFTDLDDVGTPDQVQRAYTVSDTDKTSSSNWSSNAATSSRTPSSIHSAAADPSSGILEPR